MSTLIFKIPGLPGDDGRVSWHAREVEYVRGRNLAGYLADLQLEPGQVHHVVIDGRVLKPEEMVRVALPEKKWARRLRKVLRKPAPTVEVSAFDAYHPRRGEEIAIVPCVEGKNRSVIFGAIGIVVGIALAAHTGGASLSAWGAFQAGVAGWSVGSAIGGLTTPRPKLIKDKDGPSSYVFGGTQNDDRAGVAKPILTGQRLVGGKRIGMVRRRPGVVPVRTGPTDYSDSNPITGSERISLLILIAAHRCEGPVGITTPDSPANNSTNLADVRLNGTHYSNFTGTTVEWRTGAPGQSVIRGFDVAASTYDLAVDLTDLNTHYIYTTVDAVDAFEVLLQLPGLMHTHEEKGIQKNSTVYRLEYRKLGTTPWHNADYDGSRTLKAQTSALRLETRRVEKFPDGTPLERARYEIRLRWLSAEFTDSTKDLWHVQLTGVTEEVQESRNYEGESILAVSGIATEQLSGAIPTVTSVWRGYIPQKYIASMGGWQPASWGVGTFAPAGKNRFWIALALMRDTRIGGGNEITDEEIDLASFEAAAPEADVPELVEPLDGPSYSEPRHQFSAYIDQEQEAVDLIQQILAPARATLIFTGNKWRVGVDKPGPLTQVFGMGSIVCGPDGESSFNLRFKSERREINCVEGTFSDAAADWQTESHLEYIDNRDPDADDTVHTPGTFVTGTDPEAQLTSLGLPVLRRRLDYWGTDRRSEVARELRLELRKAYALREAGTFTAYTEALIAETFDLIGVSDDTPLWGYSGRVAESGVDPSLPEALRTVMFDRPVPFETGVAYELKIRFREPGVDGKELIETRTVADTVAPAEIQGEYIGLTVTAPFSRIPEKDDEWFFGPVDRSVRPVRIVDIDRDENDERVITFAEYNETVYDVSGPIVIPQYSLLPDLAAPPGPIPELKATSDIIRLDDGRRPTNILLQWSRPNPLRNHGPYKGARVDYSFDNAAWTTLESVDGVEHRWIDAPHGVHIWFRVIPYSVAGKYNFAGAAFADIIPEGYGLPSPVITGLTGGYADGAFWLEWAPLGPEYEYEVRQANPANWKTDQSGYLWRGKLAKFYDDSPDARSITYYVRARDPFGNYSSAASSFIVADAAPAAPTITSITRFQDGFNIVITPPAGTDLLRMNIHAAQTPGFTPSDGNRKGQLGPKGGTFFFKTSVAGTWYFKAAAEDWLSDRMDDRVYSSEDDDQIIVIAPVDPTGVSLAFVNIGTVDIDKDERGYGTRPRYRGDIAWSHADAVNPSGSLIGWQIVIYDTTDGITRPLKDSGVVADPSIRAYSFQNVSQINSATAIAAVKAVYIDGVTSDYVTSTGETIPQATNPRIRDSDDRTVPSYAETFDKPSLPGGFSILNAFYSLTSPDGELTLTTTGTPSSIIWVLNIWADEKPIDSTARHGGFGVVQIRAKLPASAAGAVLAFSDGINSPITINDAIFDDEWHQYSVPLGALPDDLVYAVTFNLSGAALGTVWRVTGVGVAFEGVDLSLAESIDRGIQARRNFERDPDGDGMYAISPIRIGDANGNYFIVEENGHFYLRDEAGNLITETPPKLHRQGRITQYTNGARIKFGETSVWGLRVPLPLPTSYDQVRFLAQDVGNTFLPSSAPAGTTIFRWLEASNFGDDAFGDPSFKLAGIFFYGGTLRRHTVTGPWSSSNQAKSALFLSSTSSNTTDQINDAWYYVQDDTRIEGGTLPIDDTLPWPMHVYFRCVVWIAIAMPDARRSNGSRYYADLDFTVRIGKATLQPSHMELPASPSIDVAERGPFRVRLLSDGEVHRIPIILGADNSDFMSRDYQNVKVDWHGRTWESGGSGLIECGIDEITWTYIENCQNYESLSNADIGFVWLEGHAGGQ